MADEVHPPSRSNPSAPAAQTVTPAHASARTGLGARLLYVIKNETEGLHPRLRVAGLLVAPLPHFTFVRLRTAIYRLVGLRIGARSLLLGRIELVGPSRVHERFSMGEDCQITTPLYADACAPIQIGNRVYIGHHARLITTNHEIGPEWKRCGGWRAASTLR